MNHNTDELTGLFSGETLYEEAEALIAKEGEFAFVIMDIDNLLALIAEKTSVGEAALLREALDHLLRRYRRYPIA